MSNWNIYITFKNIFLRNGLYCSSWQNTDEDWAYIYIIIGIYIITCIKIIRIILLRNQIITEFTSYAKLNLFEFGPGNEKKLKRAMFKKLQVLTSITECSIACMRYLRSFPHCMHILQKCIRMRLYFCSWEKLTFLHNDLFSFM